MASVESQMLQTQKTDTENPKILKPKPRKISVGKSKIRFRQTFICHFADSFNKSGERENPDSFVFHQQFSSLIPLPTHNHQVCFSSTSTIEKGNRNFDAHVAIEKLLFLR